MTTTVLNEITEKMSEWLVEYGPDGHNDGAEDIAKLALAHISKLVLGSVVAQLNKKAEEFDEKAATANAPAYDLVAEVLRLEAKIIAAAGRQVFQEL